MTDLSVDDEVPPAVNDGRTFQLLMSITALLISIVAMWISVYEINVIRTEERAQVWPYVDVGFRYGDGRVAVVARNKGTGPALVKHFSFAVDDVVFTDWLTAFTTLTGPDHGISYENSNFSGIDGEVMSPDEQITLMSIPLGLSERFTPYASQIRFNYCYCSVHDDCWQLSHQSRTQVEHCAARP